ncbi:MAG: VWA domain-containing protein [Myxococcota bacterium]
MTTAGPDAAGPAASAGPRMLFAKLFYGLRGAGVKVGPTEWMLLVRAMAEQAIEPSLEALYAVGRAVLVKHEAHFDTWDQVFAATFADGVMPVELKEELMDWLANPIERPGLSPEELAALESLSLEELRRRFLERMAEQDERHDGGSKWIGTGGTSPFGHGGQNPSGLRVGGAGGGRSAVQVAEARRYRDYRSDRILDTRALAVALRKLRRLGRVEGEPELDVEESIDSTCKNAGDLTLEFRPPRENQARVLLLMDVGGSMSPYTRLVETLFSAASGLNHWKKLEAFFFHNCPYSRVWKSMTAGEVEPLAEILKSRPPETFLLLVGDASMAPSELMSAHGAIDWFERSETPGLVWLHRLRSHFTRSAWVNPMEPAHWRGYTVELIARLFPMFPLTVDGLGQAVEHLVRKTPPAPVPELDQRLFREGF